MFKTDDVIVYMGGAGCAKTSALMRELEIACTLYNPDEIAFVSFSRKAAEEAKSRARGVVEGFVEDNYPYFKTLHALTFMVNEYESNGKKIIGKRETDYFGKHTRFKFNIHNEINHGQKKSSLGQQCFDWYNLERSANRVPLPKEMPEQLSYQEFKDLYEKFKEVNNVIDYHDCLSDYIKYGKPLSKVKFALIDEAQDLTPVQWEVCYKLFEDTKSIRIAGDCWQCIYRYLGAEPKILIELSNRYKLVKLENSYRLPVKVAKFADVVSDAIKEKVEKKVIPVKKEIGDIRFFTSLDYFLPVFEKNIDEEWYILTRANYQIDNIASVLKEKLILFNYSNGYCLPVTELTKIKQYYKWSSSFDKPSDDLKFCKRYGIRGDRWERWFDTELVSTKWRERIRMYERKFGFEKLWEHTYKPTNILLSTVFKVKGGEADNVAILTSTTQKIESAKYEDMDNETRVLYVAITRSKKNLYFFDMPSRYNMTSRVKYFYERSKK